MPAKSKQQFKFMAGVASGNISAPGLSKQKAKEYLSADYKELPKYSKFKKLNKTMKREK